MKNLLITLSLVFPLSVSSQNYKNDLLTATKNMVTLRNYSMKIHYKIFLDNKTDKIFQERIREVKRRDDDLFYKENDGKEFMENTGYEISIDHSKKWIAVRKKENVEEEPYDKVRQKIGSYLDGSVEDLLKEYSSIRLIKSSPGKVTYELIFKDKPEIKNMIITINTEKKSIELVRYTYKDPIEIPELKNTMHHLAFEITYENLEINKIKDKSSFDERKYVAINKTAIRTTAAYQHYTLKLLN